MRVALYVHCYYPEHFFGTEAYTRMIARELLALGHEPTVVAANFAGEPSLEASIERYAIDGVPVLRIDKNLVPHGDLAETYHQPAMADIHRRILREIAPDVLHVCHLVNHTAALLDVAAELAIPAFATFTDFFGFCFNNKLEAADGALCKGPSRSRANCVACLLRETAGASRGARRLLSGPALRTVTAGALARWPRLAGRDAAHIEGLVMRPDRLARSYRTYRAAVAPTRFLHDAYRANGFSEGLRISHFGIDIDRSPKPVRTRGRDGALRLGYIGQLARHKGVHVLLEAMRALGGARLSLDVYGSDDQDPAYAAELRRGSAGLPVRYRGVFPVSELARVLGELDVVVIPSLWYENSPLILLQALATHTPVVVSDVPGMSEFVRDGENGFAFERGDPASLARVLAALAEEPDLATRLGAGAAYERTPRHMAVDLVELWAEHGVRIA